MIDIDQLRRLAQAALIAPGSLSPEWMDRLGQFQEAADPAAVSELLDRLEEARTAWKEANKACRDLTEKVIPNLRESLEAAERDVALKEKVIDALGSELNAVAKERGALQAKIDAMEKQEPVYLFRRKGLDDFCTCSKERYEVFSANPRLFEVKTLYALPGAQPAPSIHEVTDAMALAFHDALTDGSIGEHEMEEIKAGLRAALAAAPEPKP